MNLLWSTLLAGLLYAAISLSAPPAGLSLFLTLPAAAAAAGMLSAAPLGAVVRLYTGGEAAWRAFGRDLRAFGLRTALLALLAAAVSGLLAFNMAFLLAASGNHPAAAGALLGLNVAFTAALAGTLLYAAPLLFLRGLSPVKALRHGFLLLLAHFRETAAVLLLLAVWGWLCLLFLPLGFFLGPVAAAGLPVVALENHFLRYKMDIGGVPWRERAERWEAEGRRGWRQFLRPWERG